jgi:hypothetical protein
VVSQDTDVDPQAITSVLLIIDSSREINLGMAPHFPPVPLNGTEIMLNENNFEYLDVEVGDSLRVELDIPGLNSAIYGQTSSGQSLV